MRINFGGKIKTRKFSKILCLEVMDFNYFDMDDIIASQQTVSCAFLTDVLKLGFFDTNNENEDLKSGVKLNLPCWLAKGLVTRSQRAVVKVAIPRTYCLNYRQILEADPHVVDLKRFSSHFYDFGLILMSFGTEDMEQINNTLTQTFIDRFRYLMDKSNNESVDVKPTNLDKREKRIYDLGQRAMVDYMEWKNRKIEQVVASQLVTNKKRKISTLTGETANG